MAHMWKSKVNLQEFAFSFYQGDWFGNQIRVVRLDSKYLGPEAISTVLFCVFLIPDVLTGMRSKLSTALFILLVASDERSRVSRSTVQWVSTVLINISYK